MSWTTTLKFGLSARWAMLSRLPVRKLSRARTCCPSARNRSHKWDPMNPAPPVISVRCTVGPPRLQSAYARRGKKQPARGCAAGGSGVYVFAGQLLRRGLGQLFFGADDDPRRHHDHDVPGVTPDADVLEEPVEVRDLAQYRRAELFAPFGHRLQPAEQHRPAVRHGDRGLDVDGGEGRLLQELGERDRLALRTAF